MLSEGPWLLLPQRPPHHHQMEFSLFADGLPITAPIGAFEARAPTWNPVLASRVSWPGDWAADGSRGGREW